VNDDKTELTKGYFDYNATTPVHPEVAEAMAEALAEGFGNPSSMHAAGRRVRAMLDSARADLATLLGCESTEIVFTSGATEANNYIMRGFGAAHPRSTVAVSAIDHHSVLETANALEREGRNVVRLDVDENALPDFDEVRALATAAPALFTTSLANGETGHIAPAALWREAVGADSYLHWDAAQAVGRIPLAPAGTFDFLSLSAHKFGGPKGTGAAVVRRERFGPLLFGGPQEDGLRAGTENVAGIVGMGTAAAICKRTLDEEGARLSGLRDGLWAKLSETLGGDIKRITPEDGLPNTLTLGLTEPAGDVMVAGLDLAGFAVSTGSACAAGAPEPSHVVRGIGLEPEYRNGVIRISMGRFTTAQSVNEFATAFLDVVERAKKAA
jgi:cysteine desulfurase